MWQWEGVSISTAQDAADLLAPLFAGLEGEKLVVLCLDAERQVLGVDEYPGLADEAALPIRPILAASLRRDAAGLIIAHNHPSGSATPSRADLEATRRLAEAAALLDIRLHDHLIFAGGECRSFRELGLL